MKRPAEQPLEAEGRRGSGPPGPSPGTESNPFAGLSLSFSAAAPTGGSLFTTTASTAATAGFTQTSAPGSGAAAQLPPGGGNGETTNPFMGLSLFSPPLGGPLSPGSLFTAAANSLPQNPGKGTTAEPTPEAGEGGPPPAEEDTAEAEEQEEETGPQDAGEAGEPTGEEDEEVLFRAECKLWKLVPATTSGGGAKAGESKEESVAAGGAGATSVAEEKAWRWQERGCGVVHINRHKRNGAGRLVMRMRGVLKLLLNTPVLPTTKYEKVGQKSVRFVGVDSEKDSPPSVEGQVTLCAYRLSLQSGDQQGKFLTVLRDGFGVTLPG